MLLAEICFAAGSPATMVTRFLLVGSLENAASSLILSASSIHHRAAEPLSTGADWIQPSGRIPPSARA